MLDFACARPHICITRSPLNAWLLRRTIHRHPGPPTKPVPRWGSLSRCLCKAAQVIPPQTLLCTDRAGQATSWNRFTPRSRTRGPWTDTLPIPVKTSRSGRKPCRTNRWRPLSSKRWTWPARNSGTSARTAVARSSQAPARSTSGNGSGEKSLGFVKSITVFFVMWHILFSTKIAARQQRQDMPAIRAVTNFQL